MIPETVVTAHSLGTPSALEQLRIKLMTPDPEPIYNAVFDAHMDALDPNLDRLEQDVLYAMHHATRPTA